MTNQQIIDKTKLLIKPFKIYGDPAIDRLSEGQFLIIGSIVFKVNPRIACLAPTGYGKSEAVAIGAILRGIKGEDFIIASVKYGTSDIIMGKVIDHLFDDPFLTKQMELESGFSLDRLRRERKKNSINFREGGSLKIISLHGKDDDLTKAIGEHAQNIILDESPLLSASKYFQVLKILEGTGKYSDTFLLELGNAINRNHFMFNTLHNSKYFKINISLEQALQEQRLDRESVEEKRNMPFFDQFYLNKFPEEDEIDERGYRQLLTESDIQNAFVDNVEVEDELILGLDLAGGGDENSYTLRGAKYAWIETTNRSNDTMTNVSEVERLLEKYEQLEANSICLDDIGIGRGVSDRLLEKDLDINPVSVGGKSKETDKYYNLKAEYYWLARMWIKEGGKLKRDDRFFQLTQIKYKISSDKSIQIEPKEDLKKRTGRSPDHAESFMLTFAETHSVGLTIL